MRSDLLIAIIGNDEAVSNLGTKLAGHRNRAIDGEHHPGLQHGLVTVHELRAFEETEPGRATAAKRILLARGLDYLRVGTVDLLGSHSWPQNGMRCGLTVNRCLVGRLLDLIGDFP